MLRNHSAILVLAVVVALNGCAQFTRQDALIVSGESLKAADKEFRVVDAAYVSSCGKVPRQPSDAECTAFRDFGRKWIQAFPMAADLWLAAKEANDTATVAGAARAITALVAELSTWAIKMLAFVTPAGK